MRVSVEVVIGLDASSYESLSDRPYRREWSFQLVRNRCDEICADRRDGGARAGRASGRKKAQREQRDPRADDDEAPPGAARRQHERRIPCGTRGDSPGPLREIDRWIDRNQCGVEEQERKGTRGD